MPLDDLEETLIAYVDGELNVDQVIALEQRLARDSTLRLRVQAYRDTAAMLRMACAERFYAPGTAQLLPLQTTRLEAGRSRRLVLWAATACLLSAMIGFGGGIYWADGFASEHDELLSEIAEYHRIFSRETTHLVEMGPDQSEQLLAWLSARLRRTVRAPDLTALGLRFAGGRLLVVNGKPVAELMYTRVHRPPVALCIAADEGRSSPIRFDKRGELRLASWNDGSQAFVVVGELDSVSLRRVARLAAVQSGV